MPKTGVTRSETTREKLPDCVGVPENRPDEENVIPGGRVSDTSHCGPLKNPSSRQLCSRLKEYGWPTMPSGNDGVRMVATLHMWLAFPMCQQPAIVMAKTSPAEAANSLGGVFPLSSGMSASFISRRGHVIIQQTWCRGLGGRAAS